jgi:hypothetical protein
MMRKRMNPKGQIYMNENTAHGFIHGKKRMYPWEKRV